MSKIKAYCFYTQSIKKRTIKYSIRYFTILRETCILNCNTIRFYCLKLTQAKWNRTVKLSKGSTWYQQHILHWTIAENHSLRSGYTGKGKVLCIVSNHTEWCHFLKYVLLYLLWNYIVTTKNCTIFHHDIMSWYINESVSSPPYNRYNAWYGISVCYKAKGRWHDINKLSPIESQTNIQYALNIA